jgi:hypothetical protein
MGSTVYLRIKIPVARTPMCHNEFEVRAINNVMSREGKADNMTINGHFTLIVDLKMCATDNTCTRSTKVVRVRPYVLKKHT